MKVGKIYKIVANNGDDVYIGSTFDRLTNRFGDHKSAYKRGILITSKFMFDKYGVDGCSIILIKEYNVIDRKHLQAYEQLAINRLRCVNKNNLISIRFQNIDENGKRYYVLEREYSKNYYKNNKEIIKEYREQNKEIIKEQREKYRKANKEIIKERSKNYYKKNKEILNKKKKQYYEANKQTFKEYQKQYREMNTETIKEYQKNYRKNSEIITCECGSSVKKNKISDHIKSKKHQAFINRSVQNL